MEASAKAGVGVTEAFEHLVRCVMCASSASLECVLWPSFDSFMLVLMIHVGDNLMMIFVLLFVVC